MGLEWDNMTRSLNLCWFGAQDLLPPSLALDPNSRAWRGAVPGSLPPTPTSIDINECTSLSEPCRPGFSCINTVGSYTCQRNALLCGRGYHASQDGTTCVGKASRLPIPWPSLAFLGFWPVGRSCRGRAQASGCPGHLPLADVNECEAGVHHCREGQVCHNLPGSYRCDCKAGFQQDAFSQACIGRRGLVAMTPLWFL